MNCGVNELWLLLLITTLVPILTQARHDQDLRPSLSCLLLGDYGCKGKCGLLCKSYGCYDWNPTCDGAYCDCREQWEPIIMEHDVVKEYEGLEDIVDIMAVRFKITPVFLELEEIFYEDPALMDEVIYFLTHTHGHGKPLKDQFRQTFPDLDDQLRRLKPRIPTEPDKKSGQTLEVPDEPLGNLDPPTSRWGFLSDWWNKPSAKTNSKENEERIINMVNKVEKKEDLLSTMKMLKDSGDTSLYTDIAKHFLKNGLIMPDGTRILKPISDSKALKKSLLNNDIIHAIEDKIKEEEELKRGRKRKRIEQAPVVEKKPKIEAAIENNLDKNNINQGNQATESKSSSWGIPSWFSFKSTGSEPSKVEETLPKVLPTAKSSGNFGNESQKHEPAESIKDNGYYSENSQEHSQLDEEVNSLPSEPLQKNNWEYGIPENKDYSFDLIENPNVNEQEYSDLLSDKHMDVQFKDENNQQRENQLKYSPNPGIEFNNQKYPDLKSDITQNSKDRPLMSTTQSGTTPEDPDWFNFLWEQNNQLVPVSSAEVAFLEDSKISQTDNGSLTPQLDNNSHSTDEPITDVKLNQSVVANSTPYSFGDSTNTQGTSPQNVYEDQKEVISLPAELKMESSFLDKSTDGRNLNFFFNNLPTEEKVQLMKQPVIHENLLKSEESDEHEISDMLQNVLKLANVPINDSTPNENVDMNIATRNLGSNRGLDELQLSTPGNKSIESLKANSPKQENDDSSVFDDEYIIERAHLGRLQGIVPDSSESVEQIPIKKIIRRKKPSNEENLNAEAPHENTPLKLSTESEPSMTSVQFEGLPGSPIIQIDGLPLRPFNTNEPSRKVTQDYQNSKLPTNKSSVPKSSTVPLIEPESKMDSPLHTDSLLPPPKIKVSNAEMNPFENNVNAENLYPKQNLSLLQNKEASLPESFAPDITKPFSGTLANDESPKFSQPKQKDILSKSRHNPLSQGIPSKEVTRENPGSPANYEINNLNQPDKLFDNFEELQIPNQLSKSTDKMSKPNQTAKMPSSQTDQDKESGRILPSLSSTSKPKKTNNNNPTKIRNPEQDIFQNNHSPTDKEILNQPGYLRPSPSENRMITSDATPQNKDLVNLNEPENQNKDSQQLGLPTDGHTTVSEGETDFNDFIKPLRTPFKEDNKPEDEVIDLSSFLGLNDENKIEGIPHKNLKNEVPVINQDNGDILESSSQADIPSQYKLYEANNSSNKFYPSKQNNNMGVLNPVIENQASINDNSSPFANNPDFDDFFDLLNNNPIKKDNLYSNSNDLNPLSQNQLEKTNYELNNEKHEDNIPSNKPDDFTGLDYNSIFTESSGIPLPHEIQNGLKPTIIPIQAKPDNKSNPHLKMEDNQQPHIVDEVQVSPISEKPDFDDFRKPSRSPNTDIQPTDSDIDLNKFMGIDGLSELNDLMNDGFNNEKVKDSSHMVELDDFSGLNNDLEGQPPMKSVDSLTTLEPNFNDFIKLQSNIPVEKNDENLDLTSFLGIDGINQLDNLINDSFGDDDRNSTNKLGNSSNLENFSDNLVGSDMPRRNEQGVNKKIPALPNPTSQIGFNLNNDNGNIGKDLPNNDDLSTITDEPKFENSNFPSNSNKENNIIPDNSGFDWSLFPGLNDVSDSFNKDSSKEKQNVPDSLLNEDDFSGSSNHLNNERKSNGKGENPDSLAQNHEFSSKTLLPEATKDVPRIPTKDRIKLENKTNDFQPISTDNYNNPVSTKIPFSPDERNENPYLPDVLFSQPKIIESKSVTSPQNDLVKISTFEGPISNAQIENNHLPALQKLVNDFDESLETGAADIPFLTELFPNLTLSDEMHFSKENSDFPMKIPITDTSGAETYKGDNDKAEKVLSPILLTGKERPNNIDDNLLRYPDTNDSTAIEQLLNHPGNIPLSFDHFYDKPNKPLEIPGAAERNSLNPLTKEMPYNMKKVSIKTPTNHIGLNPDANTSSLPNNPQVTETEMGPGKEDENNLASLLGDTIKSPNKDEETETSLIGLFDTQSPHIKDIPKKTGRKQSNFDLLKDLTGTPDNTSPLESEIPTDDILALLEESSIPNDILALPSKKLSYSLTDSVKPIPTPMSSKLTDEDIFFNNLFGVEPLMEQEIISINPEQDEVKNGNVSLEPSYLLNSDKIHTILETPSNKPLSNSKEENVSENKNSAADIDVNNERNSLPSAPIEAVQQSDFLIPQIYDTKYSNNPLKKLNVLNKLSQIQNLPASNQINDQLELSTIEFSRTNSEEDKLDELEENIKGLPINKKSASQISPKPDDLIEVENAYMSNSNYSNMNLAPTNAEDTELITFPMKSVISSGIPIKANVGTEDITNIPTIIPDLGTNELFEIKNKQSNRQKPNIEKGPKKYLEKMASVKSPLNKSGVMNTPIIADLFHNNSLQNDESNLPISSLDQDLRDTPLSDEMKKLVTSIPDDTELESNVLPDLLTISSSSDLKEPFLNAYGQWPMIENNPKKGLLKRPNIINTPKTSSNNLSGNYREPPTIIDKDSEKILFLPTHDELLPSDIFQSPPEVMDLDQVGLPDSLSINSNSDLEEPFLNSNGQWPMIEKIPKKGLLKRPDIINTPKIFSNKLTGNEREPPMNLDKDLENIFSLPNNNELLPSDIFQSLPEVMDLDQVRLPDSLSINSNSDLEEPFLNSNGQWPMIETIPKKGLLKRPDIINTPKTFLNKLSGNEREPPMNLDKDLENIFSLPNNNELLPSDIFQSLPEVMDLDQVRLPDSLSINSNSDLEEPFLNSNGQWPMIEKIPKKGLLKRPDIINTPKIFSNKLTGNEREPPMNLDKDLENIFSLPNNNELLPSDIFQSLPEVMDLDQVRLPDSLSINSNSDLEEPFLNSNGQWPMIETIPKKGLLKRPDIINTPKTFLNKLSGNEREPPMNLDKDLENIFSLPNNNELLPSDIFQSLPEVMDLDQVRLPDSLSINSNSDLEEPFLNSNGQWPMIEKIPKKGLLKRPDIINTPKTFLNKLSGNEREPPMNLDKDLENIFSLPNNNELLPSEIFQSYPKEMDLGQDLLTEFSGEPKVANILEPSNKVNSRTTNISQKPPYLNNYYKPEELDNGSNYFESPVSNPFDIDTTNLELEHLLPQEDPMNNYNFFSDVSPIGTPTQPMRASTTKHPIKQIQNTLGNPALIESNLPAEGSAEYISASFTPQIMANLNPVKDNIEPDFENIFEILGTEKPISVSPSFKKGTIKLPVNIQSMNNVDNDIGSEEQSRGEPGVGNTNPSAKQNKAKTLLTFESGDIDSAEKDLQNQMTTDWSKSKEKPTKIKPTTLFDDKSSLLPGNQELSSYVDNISSPSQVKHSTLPQNNYSLNDINSTAPPILSDFINLANEENLNVPNKSDQASNNLLSSSLPSLQNIGDLSNQPIKYKLKGTDSTAKPNYRNFGQNEKKAQPESFTQPKANEGTTDSQTKLAPARFISSKELDENFIETGSNNILPNKKQTIQNIPFLDEVAADDDLSTIIPAVERVNLTEEQRTPNELTEENNFELDTPNNEENSIVDLENIEKLIEPHNKFPSKISFSSTPQYEIPSESTQTSIPKGGQRRKKFQNIMDLLNPEPLNNKPENSQNNPEDIPQNLQETSTITNTVDTEKKDSLPEIPNDIRFSIDSQTGEISSVTVPAQTININNSPIFNDHILLDNDALKKIPIGQDLTEKYPYSNNEMEIPNTELRNESKAPELSQANSESSTLLMDILQNNLDNSPEFSSANDGANNQKVLHADTKFTSPIINNAADKLPIANQSKAMEQFKEPSDVLEQPMSLMDILKPTNFNASPESNSGNKWGDNSYLPSDINISDDKRPISNQFNTPEHEFIEQSNTKEPSVSLMDILKPNSDDLSDHDLSSELLNINQALDTRPDKALIFSPPIMNSNPQTSNQIARPSLSMSRPQLQPVKPPSTGLSNSLFKPRNDAYTNPPNIASTPLANTSHANTETPATKIESISQSASSKQPSVEPSATQPQSIKKPITPRPVRPPTQPIKTGLPTSLNSDSSTLPRKPEPDNVQQKINDLMSSFPEQAEGSLSSDLFNMEEPLTFGLGQPTKPKTMTKPTANTKPLGNSSGSLRNNQSSRPTQQPAPMSLKPQSQAANSRPTLKPSPPPSNSRPAPAVNKISPKPNEFDPNDPFSIFVEKEPKPTTNPIPQTQVDRATTLGFDDFGELDIFAAEDKFTEQEMMLAVQNPKIRPDLLLSTQSSGNTNTPKVETPPRPKVETPPRPSFATKKITSKT